jgi:hypothetical protein
VRQDLESARLVELLPEHPPLHDTFRLLYRRTSPMADVLAELAAVLRSRPLT